MMRLKCAIKFRRYQKCPELTQEQAISINKRDHQDEGIKRESFVLYIDFSCIFCVIYFLCCIFCVVIFHTVFCCCIVYVIFFPVTLKTILYATDFSGIFPADFWSDYKEEILSQNFSTRTDSFSFDLPVYISELFECKKF